MKSDVNKHALIQYLCDANGMNSQLQLIRDKCEYHHEEADVKIVSYIYSYVIFLYCVSHVELRFVDSK